ncbi:MAG: ABC transporter permease subunit [Pseudomonadota bacterium]
MGKRLSPVLITALAFGYAFLYLPIAVLIGYSFNASDRVTVWEGFSTRWYAALLRNDQILDAAFLSLKIATVTATLATILGLMAAFILVRFTRFRGRTLFAGMVAAPLVIPEVITGLSLLLLFVALGDSLGWPARRGAMTVTIAHITFAMAFVAVVVQARLARIDRSIEEAALDLGARPWKVFLTITVPMVLPALVAGWLLAFTLSLDDLVIASFVSGPGASTLPMVIFSKVRLGLSPEINALATLLIAAVALAVIASLFIARQRGKAAGAQAPE